MRKALFAILAAISLALCTLILLLYARVIPYGPAFPPADSFTIHWYAQGPAIPAAPPSPTPPDDADTQPDDISAEAMAKLFAAAMGRQPMDEVLTDHPLWKLSRAPADDGGKHPTRWRYSAAVPMLLAIPPTLILPIWWSIRRFRACAYARRNARLPDSHVGARLTMVVLALVLCTGLAIAHYRGSQSPSNPGFGWCTSNATIVGGSVAGGSTMLYWRSLDLMRDDGTLVHKYRGDWLWHTVGVAYAHWTNSASILVFFPTLILHALAALLALGTLMRLRRELRGFHRLNHGLCHQCGYDLRSSKDRCPECGAPIPTPANSSTATA